MHMPRVPNAASSIANMSVARRDEAAGVIGGQIYVAGGPDKGTHAWGKVVVAGTDRVAIDAVYRLIADSAG
jgi:hypothetical protein